MWENEAIMKEFIKQIRDEYGKIGKVFCPYLGSDVKMTKKGFDHLIYTKKSGKRRHTEIRTRLVSIKHIPDILSKSGTLQEYRNIRNDYFGFIAILDSKKYKVIVLRGDDGVYKFVSIIPKWKTSIGHKNQNTYPIE